MSHESNFQERMRKLDNMTADFLANLSGIPGTRLSQAFRGLKDLDNDQIRTVSGVLTELEALAADLAPIPVAFRNAKSIRAVLEEKKRGNLLIDVRIAADVWAKADTIEVATQ